ncbi:hypothetical protein M885DRAFT_546447 [Pelagophyceae sp. CCMP2097]|nr:hypothetical protein M885DRAFT_546447 [Pelagophyceae sp. CCMP2097]
MDAGASTRRLTVDASAAALRALRERRRATETYIAAPLPRRTRRVRAAAPTAALSSANMLCNAEIDVIATHRAQADMAELRRAAKLRLGGDGDGALSNDVRRAEECGAAGLAVAGGGGAGALPALMPRFEKALEALGSSADFRAAFYAQVYDHVEPLVSQARGDFYDFPLARTVATARDVYAAIVQAEALRFERRLDALRSACVEEIDALQTKLVQRYGIKAANLAVPPKWLVASNGAARCIAPLLRQRDALRTQLAGEARQAAARGGADGGAKSFTTVATRPRPPAASDGGAPRRPPQGAPGHTAAAAPAVRAANRSDESRRTFSAAGHNAALARVDTERRRGPAARKSDAGVPSDR